MKISMQYKLRTFRNRGGRKKHKRDKKSDEKSFKDFAKLPQKDVGKT